MGKVIFSSVLSGHFSDFIAFRRSGGADYTSQAKHLLYFDRFLCQEGFNCQWLSRDVIQRYVASTKHLHSETRIHRLSTVRQFCLYLRQFDAQYYVPEPMRRRGQTSSRIPHIFTDNEIKSLLRAARQLPPPGLLRPMTFYTLFGLLYATGLRIGEAIALGLADVDINHQRLYIHNSKFRKSRWVPMSTSTCLALNRYIQERIRVAPAAPEDPLFINLHGRRFFHQIVYQAFREAMSRCGLRNAKGSPGPRIHDLRHSYACNCLLRWYREGKDVNALLPVLAVYLGHAEFTYTQVYLRATAELLEEANQRFLKNFRQNLLQKGEKA